MASIAKELQRRVTTWLRAVVGDIVYPANDKGLRPDLPYLTVNVSSIRQVGQDETIATLTGQWTLTIADAAVGDLGTYAITVNGTAYTLTPELTDTKPNIATSLVAEIDALGLELEAVADAAVVTFTALDHDMTVSMAANARYTFAAADDVGAIYVIGTREATVTVNGYGEESDESLQEATWSLYSPSIQAVYQPLELSIELEGSMLNLSELVDTEIEHRYAQDYLVLYRHRSTLERIVELAEVQVETEYNSDSSADQTETITVDLSG